MREEEVQYPEGWKEMDFWPFSKYGSTRLQQMKLEQTSYRNRWGDHDSVDMIMLTNHEEKLHQKGSPI